MTRLSSGTILAGRRSVFDSISPELAVALAGLARRDVAGHALVHAEDEVALAERGTSRDERGNRHSRRRDCRADLAPPVATTQRPP